MGHLLLADYSGEIFDVELIRASALYGLSGENPRNDIFFKPAYRPRAQLNGFRESADLHVVVNG